MTNDSLLAFSAICRLANDLDAKALTVVVGLQLRQDRNPVPEAI